MDIHLPQQRPLGFRTRFNSRTDFKIKTFFGLSPNGSKSKSLQPSSWGNDGTVMLGLSHRITSSADFSRKRPRKISTPRTQDSSSRGFLPRTQVGTSSQKREQKSDGDKEYLSDLPSNDFGSSSNNATGTEVETKEGEFADVDHARKTEEESGYQIGDIGDEELNVLEKTSLGDLRQVTDTEGYGPFSNEFANLKEANGALKSNCDDSVRRGSIDMSLDSRMNKFEIDYSHGVTAPIEADAVSIDATFFKEKQVDTVMQEEAKQQRILSSGDSKASEAITKRNNLSTDEVPEIASEERMPKDSPLNKANYSVSAKEKDKPLSLKVEMEANLPRQDVEMLAEKNSQEGSKLFCYPAVVKPDQEIELFLNKSLSSLTNEPDIVMMGAFNGWRWKSFKIKLNKAHLNGDWWSCKLHVPKEAYKIDFVFFNDKDIYDNNDQKDFCLTVEGGMDELDFEDFLLDEKRKELEKIAAEKAEREKLEEEQRNVEAEKASREADRAQAREEIAKRRETFKELVKRAAKSLDSVWYIEPSEFKGMDRVRLFYNRKSGPLVLAEHIWIHGGYNNWSDGLSIVATLVKSERPDGDWWYTEVVIPDSALILDWVFCEGPPQHATIYDNNHLKDFHAIVPLSIPEELYWVEEENHIYQKLQKDRQLREEALHAKAIKTARMKEETKARTLRAFLLSQRHIVYCEPLEVRAGSTVTVFYNPANTVLNGKPEIWFRCSFNHWTHRRGPLPPQRMLPVENSSHVRARVRIPLDAYTMDFVFSEREDGGIFDNKNGMDYHLPVFGGAIREPPMHIVHISVEMAPIAKVGGLGDVVTSLSRAIQDLTHTVDIVLPKYDCLNITHVKDFRFHKSYLWGGTEIKVWFGMVEGLSVYFLEPQNGFFWKGCIYGCGSDGERFGFFCHAALEFLLQNGFHPDIIHCHDWSTAPVSWLFKDQYRHYGLSKARIVFTIHNLEFGAQLIGKAMAYSDKATTVSPTYSQEVSRNPCIAPHLYKFHGILNGIDPDIWDPYNDKFIPVSYTSENVVEGKRAAKEFLQQRLGLKGADIPMVGIITRLTHQKGIHLIKHAIWRTLDRGGQVVLLGSAPDPRIQNDFVNLKNQLHSSHNDRAHLCLTYDEPLSHLIYAGADFILVPSIFEPCGLTQLTAMRYGSIPVVRKTGGLYDTVFDVDHDKERAQARGLEPNGFNFDGADAAGVDYALIRAISAWYESQDWFNSLCQRVMEQDWSWNRPALDYLELYHAARKERAEIDE